MMSVMKQCHRAVCRMTWRPDTFLMIFHYKVWKRRQRAADAQCKDSVTRSRYSPAHCSVVYKENGQNYRRQVAAWHFDALCMYYNYCQRGTAVAYAYDRHTIACIYTYFNWHELASTPCCYRRLHPAIDKQSLQTSPINKRYLLLSLLSDW